MSSNVNEKEIAQWNLYLARHVPVLIYPLPKEHEKAGEFVAVPAENYQWWLSHSSDPEWLKDFCMRNQLPYTVLAEAPKGKAAAVKASTAYNPRGYSAPKKMLADLGATEFQAAEASADRERAALIEEMIGAGRGNETPAQTAKKADPLSQHYNAIVAIQSAMGYERERRKTYSGSLKKIPAAA